MFALLLPTLLASRSALADPDGHWSRLPPEVRSEHALVADSPRRRLLLIDSEGGIDPGVWAISTTDYSWAELPAYGDGPTGTRSLVGFYDPTSDDVVVMDRFSLAAWRLSPEAEWSSVNSMGQPQYLHGSLAFDTRRGRVLLFGGTTQYATEVWALSFAGASGTWAPLTVSGAPPQPRAGSMVVYDRARDRLIVHGGYEIRFNDANESYVDTWELPLGSLTWSKLPVRDVPGAGECNPIGWVLLPGEGFYDAIDDRIVRLRQGCDTVRVATYSVDDTMWRPVVASGAWPSWARSVPVADAWRERLLVCGSPQDTAGSALFHLTLAGPPAWRQLTPTWRTPLRRTSHAATYDAGRTSMIVTMGRGIVSPLDDTWELSLTAVPSWSRLEARTPPTPRVDCSLVSNPPFTDELLFGGDTSGVVDELYDLVPGGREPRWFRRSQPAVRPPARSRHAAVALAGRDQMVVFGGVGNADAAGNRPHFNDTWLLDRSWRRLDPLGGPPPARAGHTAVYDPSRRRVIVHGGDSSWVDGAGPHRLVYGDTWAFTIADSTWTRLGTDGPRRTEHAAVYDAVRDRMVVYGGIDDNGADAGDVWALSLADLGWSRLTPSGRGPTPRAVHTAVYDPQNDRMIVYGGASQGSAWPSLDTWLLDWGSTAMPQVACAWAGPDEPGGDATFTGVVTSHMEAPQDYVCSLTMGSALPTYTVPKHLSPGQPDTIRWVIPIPDSIEGEIATTFEAVCSGEPLPGNPCAATLSIPVLIESARASIGAGRIDIEWQTGAKRVGRATVYRRVAGSDWRALARIEAESNTLVFEDTAVPEGLLCAYRLGIATSRGEVFRGEIEVEAPGAVDLAAWPNPAPGPLSVAFTVGGDEYASLELFDVSGRRVIDRRMGRLPAGVQVVKLSEAAALDEGVYFLRMTRGRTTLTTRVCLVR